MEDWKAELAESFWEIERSNKVLRTKKDRDGDLWFELEPDRFFCNDGPDQTRERAQKLCDDWGGGLSLSDVDHEFGPLIDVTDTGEPLPEPGDAGPLINQCESISPVNTYRCDHTKNHRGAHEHQGVEWHGAYPTEHAPKITCAGASVGEPIKPLTYGKDYQIGDTDVLYRKPEPGDRVPQIGDTVAVALDEENGSTVVGILSATYDDKFWIEGDDFDLQVPHQGSQITVIEPARPAAPEEPESVSVVEDKEGVFWLRLAGERGYCWESPDPRFDNVGWEDLWYERGPLVSYERGPVVGGSGARFTFDTSKCEGACGSSDPHTHHLRGIREVGA